MTRPALFLVEFGLVWATARAESVVPGKEWERIPAERAGYSTKRFDALRSYLATIETTAMMVVN
ncbi:MAG: hypothetical protein FJW39_00155 [Acidobacteria bacterium]|nr:hypothetical protein [Acidobacteriota bacterium]